MIKKSEKNEIAGSATDEKGNRLVRATKGEDMCELICAMNAVFFCTYSRLWRFGSKANAGELCLAPPNKCDGQCVDSRTVHHKVGSEDRTRFYA